ncbi:MAG: FMN-binding protein [Spirochaetae bacterium HGW-Spirochaetae-3]|jgi:hypothetical protein|nr:MAG: FMN-binding protein [Spirochaetae bacterium HGW-Spirochaetae-3]
MKKLIVLAASVLFCASFAFANGQKEMTMGVGHSSNFRVGPGKDSTGTQVYSFNYVYATVIFDGAGKIVDLEIDALEVSTPNYDGASMPHFAGWPGSPELNLTDHTTEKVAGTAPNTAEAVAAEVAAWKSKRDRGDAYGMNPKNDWHRQMDAYEKLFIGMTVDEVEAWTAKYLSEVNGRILNPATTNEKDKAKLATLTDDDKKLLIDARSGATMSINDAHGSVVGVIRDAWNKRKPLGK